VVTRERPKSPAVSELLGHNVKRVRERRKLSRARLEELLGWTTGTVKRIESCERSGGVSVDELIQLAYALDVAPAVLLTPWTDDDRLPVERPGYRTLLKSGDAWRWLVGWPPETPASGPLLVQWKHYFETVPRAVNRQQSERWLDRLRAWGWNLDEQGRNLSVGGSWYREPDEPDADWRPSDELPADEQLPGAQEAKIAAATERRHLETEAVHRRNLERLRDLPADDPFRRFMEDYLRGLPPEHPDRTLAGLTFEEDDR
jgi:transcriptional regulator with XRE-family HTH domain